MSLLVIPYLDPGLYCDEHFVGRQQVLVNDSFMQTYALVPNKRYDLVSISNMPVFVALGQIDYADKLGFDISIDELIIFDGKTEFTLKTRSYDDSRFKVKTKQNNSNELELKEAIEFNVKLKEQYYRIYLDIFFQVNVETAICELVYTTTVNHVIDSNKVVEEEILREVNEMKILRGYRVNAKRLRRI